jgi:hypothetical protein
MNRIAIAQHRARIVEVCFVGVGVGLEQHSAGLLGRGWHGLNNGRQAWRVKLLFY